MNTNNKSNKTNSKTFFTGRFGGAFLVFLLSLLSVSLVAQDLTGVKIYINPGHGGFDSDDRGISTPLIAAAPNQGFWESQSNLDKGFMLRDMLDALNCTSLMSRTQNRTEDDLALSTIVRQANEFGADFMLSIHTNAGAGVANYVLMLYAGKDADDVYSYATGTPTSTESRAISTEIAKNVLKNQMTYWTAANYQVVGDKTYARKYMGWSDGYGVLRGLRVPGVISEGAMHDYIPETYRLMNMEYKWLESWNFKKAFCTYFKGAEIPTGNIAGWVKDGRNLLLDGVYKKYAKDVLLPLDGAKVSIVETGEVYTVDNCRNGVYVFKDLAPGTYNVKAEAAGYYAQTQEITVVKNEITYFNFELNKIRSTPPQVVSYEPNVSITDSVECSVNVVFNFNWDMDEESTRAAFSISPAAAGRITFEDSQYRMRFVSDEPLSPGTLYTVTLDKSAKHPDNLSMAEDFTLQFVTKNRSRLALLDSYPSNGDHVYDLRPAFWLIFDKKLKTANLRTEINVYDKDDKEMSKPTRSMKNNTVAAPYGSFYFELEPLVAGEEYKVVIGGEVTDEVGIKVVEPIEINFTAESVKVEGQPVVQTFESKAYDYNAEQSTGVKTASVSLYTDVTYLYGKASNRFRCTFEDEEAYIIYKANTLDVQVSNDKVLGLHVFGDYSRNELQLEFIGDSDIRYLKLCDLDFIGWRYYELGLSSLEENKEYTITGIKVIRGDGFLSGNLEFYLDNMLLYDNLLFNSEPEIEAAALSVYPNPASDMVYVKTASNKLPLLQLYSLNGNLLKETKANHISVSEFSAGTYMLRVSTEQGLFTKPLIVVK